MKLFPVYDPWAPGPFVPFLRFVLARHCHENAMQMIEDIITVPRSLTADTESRIRKFMDDRWYDIDKLVCAVNGLRQSDEKWARHALELLGSIVTFNPSKCDLPKQYFEAWLRARMIDIVKLNGDALRWVNNEGELVDQRPTGLHAPCSIDFKVERNEITYWVSYKYGRVSEGEGQIGDGIAHLENGKLYHLKRDDPKTKFVLVLDGDAYEKTIKQINDALDHPQVGAVSTDTFCALLLRRRRR